MIRRIRSLIQYNLPVKIVALLVALVLWGYVMNDQNPSIEGTFSVPLTAINTPSGYKISQATGAVKLKVRGPRSLFVNASETDFEAYVDLENARDGRKSYRIHTIMPQGFELVEVQPETVEVTLDKIETRTFKAELIVTGATEPGTTVAKVSQSTEYVKVEGPKTMLDEVARVIGYVGLSGNSTDFSLQVPLTAINADGREVAGLTVTPGTVEASVQLARGLTKKVVSIKPVAADDLNSNLELASLKADPVKIEIAGTDEDIAKIAAIETEPISLADVTKSVSKSAKLKLPTGITVTNRDISVRIEVSKKEDTPQEQ